MIRAHTYHTHIHRGWGWGLFAGRASTSELQKSEVYRLYIRAHRAPSSKHAGGAGDSSPPVAKTGAPFPYVVRERTTQGPTVETPISTARASSTRRSRHTQSQPAEMTISRREKATAQDLVNEKNRIIGEKEVKALDEVGFKYSTLGEYS